MTKSKRSVRAAPLIAAAALAIAAVAAQSVLSIATGPWAWVAQFALIALSIASLFGVPILIIVAFFAPARRADDAVWRARAALYRATPVLQRKSAPDAAVARAFKRMSDDAVRVAAILPAHSDAGRAAAADELARRGVSAEPLPEVVVPSFFTTDDLEDPQKAVFGLSNRVRSIAGMIGGALFGCAFVLAGMNVFQEDALKADALAIGMTADEVAQIDGSKTGEFSDDVRALPRAQEMIAREQWGMGVIGAALPVIAIMFFASWLRPRPVRILLLRKFNDPKLGKAYKRLISSELQPLGHVLALADRHVQRSTFGWFAGMIARAFSSIPAAVFAVISIPILVVLRMTDRTRWGPAYVAAPRDFRLLAKRLHDRFELNLETSFVSNAYLIRTSDAWWQVVIRMLMKSADVIVLDLSNVTQGTEWEIETIGALGLWDRVVRIALDQREGDALQATAPPGPIMLYDGLGGMAGRADFRAAVFEALTRSVSARP